MQNDKVSDGFAGARVDTSDPMALFEYDRKNKARVASSLTGAEGQATIAAVSYTHLTLPTNREV